MFSEKISGSASCCSHNSITLTLHLFYILCVCVCVVDAANTGNSPSAHPADWPLDCHVMSLSVAAYPFSKGSRGVAATAFLSGGNVGFSILLEPIPALSQGEGRVLPGQVASSSPAVPAELQPPLASGLSLLNE